MGGVSSKSLDSQVKIRFTKSEYKKLKAIAAANGTSIAQMLRAPIRRFIGFESMRIQKQGLPPSPAPRDTTAGARVDLRLTVEEAKFLNSVATSLNKSRAEVLLLMMKNKHGDTPVFSHQEKDALHKSNYQLSVIGSNLNQIAKHLNSMRHHYHEGDHDRLNSKLDKLYQELHKGSIKAEIDEHVELVYKLLKASRHRFD